jgi:hypothetical protein
MPNVHCNYRLRQPPTIKLLKNERTLLARAAELCDYIGQMTSGSHPELSGRASRLAHELDDLSQIESYNLSKPF